MRSNDAASVRLMLREQPECAGQTVADMLVRLRCLGCRGRPHAIYLCEDGHGVGSLPKSLTAGWALLLHGGDEPDPPVPGRAVAAE